MKRFIRFVVVLLALIMVVGAAPATAGSSHGLAATFEEGEGGPPNYDPAALEARGCPPASGWIFGGEGTGYLTSALLGLDETPIEYSFDYCSRFVVFDPERTTGRFVGKAEAGQMTIVVDEDNALSIEFRGTWTFDGVMEPPIFTASLNLHYTIAGGTGMFDGASGHGSLSLANTVDIPGGVDTMAGTLEGSLHLK